MSRRAFKPTAEQRGCVETMIGYGVPEAEICLLIKNPKTDKPIDLESLRKHFAAEIATVEDEGADQQIHFCDNTRTRRWPR